MPVGGLALLSLFKQRVGLGAAAALVLLSACGGASSPTQPTLPETGNSVSVVVFYDDNGNGLLDAGERGRVPGALVDIAGHTASSEVLSGKATVTGVPAGTYGVTLHGDSLPPFYRTGTAPSVSVPQSGELDWPLTLPIGDNLPATYLAFGDSITDGDGSSDDQGYRSRLEARLRSYFGEGTIINDGAGGTTSAMGVRRIKSSLANYKPAYTLILYGTNDWNGSECNSTIETCYTKDSLTLIVQHVKNAKSLPFLATIIPANTGYDDRAPEDRNIRVAQQNDQIREVAKTQGAVLVDLWDAFMRTPDFHQLLSDHVHPNDAGYEIIAQTFFDAIAHGKLASARAPSPPAILDLDAPGDPGGAR